MRKRVTQGVSHNAPCNDNPISGHTSREHLNQEGAMRLAKRLQDHWHARGYGAARFWAEPIGERFEKVGTYELYRVACNLIGGLPPRYRDD